MHVVTDNAINDVAIRKLIHQMYDNFYWSHCATHCLNLPLKDIGSLPYVFDLVSHASKVIKHCVQLYDFFFYLCLGKGLVGRK